MDLLLMSLQKWILYVKYVLPRLPSQTEMVPLKVKRKLVYRGHYMYDYITPQKLMNALKFLRAKNPLYAHIEAWFEEALANDEEFCKCLLEQNDDDDMDMIVYSLRVTVVLREIAVVVHICPL